MARDSGLKPLLELLDRHELSITESEQRLKSAMEQIHHFVGVFEEMTKQNRERDEAIGAIQDETHQHVQTLGKMTEQNRERDEAIARGQETLTDMTEANARRDEAISVVNKALAEMSQHNIRRDEAIAALAEQARQCETLQQQVDSLRRRSLRVPTALCRLLGRIWGRHGSS